MAKRKKRRPATVGGAPDHAGPGALGRSSDGVAELFAAGLEHHQAGRLADAELLYRQVLAIDPSHVDSLHDLGVLAYQTGHIDAAVGLVRQAIAHNDRVPDFHNSLGAMLKSQGKLDEAEASYRRATDLKPDFADADSNRLLCLNYRSDISPEALLAEHCRWDARHGGGQGRPVPSYANPRDPDRRLRIGYVSGGFGQHPVGFFLANVLAAHDRSAVEILCYSSRTNRDDIATKLKGSADQWRNLVGVSDDEAARIIQQDGVDILIDLSGHTDDNRLTLFTRRPAPVQASWLGYPGTTGLSCVDYLLMDSAAVPPGAERWCSEAVVRRGAALAVRRTVNSVVPSFVVIRRGAAGRGQWPTVDRESEA